MKVEVILDDRELDLTMPGPNRNEGLRINGDYPRDVLSRWLFSQIGLMHLVAPHFPAKIKTNFCVSPVTENLIGAMYAFENYKAPEIISPNSVAWSFAPPLRTSAQRAVNSYSGGKDSMWNQVWMEEKYGTENVIAVHIAGLNKAVAAGERKYAEFQSKKLGFKNFRIIELQKSSAEIGAKVLRSAKIFTASILVPVALEFGSAHIITEEPGGGPYFTGQHMSMHYFNHEFLKKSGIPVGVLWHDRPQEGVVKNLILRRPDWIQYVHNCFSPAHYKISIRKSWEKRTPTFQPFASACGSCVKCRITRLGWLLYGEHRISNEDAIYFLRDTESWMGAKWETHRDLLIGSCMLYLKRGFRKYGLTPKKNSKLVQSVA